MLAPGKSGNYHRNGMALVVVPVSLDRIWQAFERSYLPVVNAITEAISPLLIVNAYGPFATTTTTRPEIIIEGSDDRQNWREYVFRYKPGPLERRPSWNIPHQPRLDWQMWFAAYGSLRRTLGSKDCYGSFSKAARLCFRCSAPIRFPIIPRSMYAPNSTNTNSRIPKRMRRLGGGGYAGRGDCISRS